MTKINCPYPRQSAWTYQRQLVLMQPGMGAQKDGQKNERFCLR